MTRRLVVAATVAAAVMTTGACGTTVPLPGGVAGPDALASGASTGISVPAAVPAAPGQPRVASPQGGSSVVPAGAGTGAGTVAARGPQASGSTRGITSTTVRIGVAYQANLDAANKALGGDRVTFGDQAADAKLVIADINAHGGIDGRRVVADYYAYDAQSSQPYVTQDQAACAHFINDDRVFAVIGAGLTETFQQCMESAGTAVVGADIVRFDAADFRRYGHYVDVQELDLERLTSALSAELLGDGWAEPWNTTTAGAGTGPVRAGVIAFDEPRFARAVQQRLVPALRAGGVQVADNDVVLVQQPTSQSDIGPAAAQVQNAVLRFRQDQVTHVVLLDTHGGITQVFLNAADAQHYYPRYGMGSGSGTEALLEGGIIRSSQLAGARGLGWIPALDLPQSADPDDGRWSSPDRRRCVSVMTAGGQSFTSTNALSVALLYCDQLWLLQRALAGRDLTSAALVAGVEQIGSRAPDANLGAASYGVGKHVGVARGVEWSFDGSCGCMTYGRVRAIT